MPLPYTPDWTHTAFSNGYQVVRCVGHPRAWRKGHYVYVQIVLAEINLGRLLRPDEVAHHADENKLNNTPDNITVLTRGDHSALHHAGAVMVGLLCPVCEQGFERPLRRVLDGASDFCSRACSNRLHGQRPFLKHGTASAYTYRRCRCTICREGCRQRQQLYREHRRNRRLVVGGAISP